MTVFFYRASDKTQVRTSLDVDIRKDGPLLLYRLHVIEIIPLHGNYYLILGEFIQICNDRWHCLSRESDE